MKKEKILIVVCVILAVISVALGGYIIYDKVNESKNITDISSLAKEKGIVISDYGEDESLFYAYLDNGNLYYQLNDGVAKKYTEMTNIKRIKSFPYGTSMRREFFLITESGKVYSTIEYFDEELTFTEADIFKGFEVDDIISKSGEVKEEFHVLLKNGKTITVTRSFDS